jgi:hypothetical protein
MVAVDDTKKEISKNCNLAIYLIYNTLPEKQNLTPSHQ